MKRKKILFALAITLAGTIATLAIVRLRPAADDQKYADKLALLSTQIAKIPDLLNTSTGQTSQNLTAYDHHMADLQDTCESLITLGKSSYRNVSRNPIEDVNRLCHDLSPLIVYSRALYQSLTDYLLLPHADWPKLTADTGQLQAARETIVGSKAALVHLGEGYFADPARPELITQLETAEKLAETCQQALVNDDQTLANNAYARLQSEIRQDQQDFLNARRYFWYNTVQLSNLQKAASQLSTQLTN